jgi:cobalamin biosynthesis protein CobT
MKINSRVVVMREAIVKIVQMLALKKIRVTQQGTGAFVEYDIKTGQEKRVNLPYLPDDATDELLDAVQGFLDHEVAHILFTARGAAARAKAKKIHSLWNIIEDSFIERKMAQAFQGSGLNLNNVGQFVLKNWIDKELAKNPGQANSILMMPAIRAWAGQTVFKDYMADKWGDFSRVTAKVGKDFEKIVASCNSSEDCLNAAIEMQRRLKDATPKPENSPFGEGQESESGEGGQEGEEKSGGGKGAESTEKDEKGKQPKKQDKKNKGKKEPEKKDEPKKKDKKKGEGEGDDAEADGGKGDGDDDAESEQGGKGDKKADEAKPDKGEGAGSGGEENKDADAEGKGEGEGDDEEAKGGAGGEGEGEGGGEADDLPNLDDADEEPGGGGKGSGESDGDTDGEFDPSAEQDDMPIDPELKNSEKVSPGGIGDFSHDPTLWAEIEAAPPVEFDEAAAELISNRAMKEAKNSDYLIYTRDYDVLERLDLPARFDDSMLKEIADGVDHMVAPMQKDIERAIAARSAAVWTGGHRTGKLHGPSLMRLRFGRDDVFRRKHENHSKDVAIGLLVDNSGSMHGGFRRSGASSMTKIKTAAWAAYGFAAVLDRMNIANEVLAFTTRSMPADSLRRLHDEQVKMGRRYSRCEALYMPIIKGFNERMTADVKKRFAWLGSGETGMANNVDGECVQIAGMRLAQRREVRKILMVFSDGHPACSGSTGELNEHLTQVVKKLIQAKIETIGIGIQDASVKHFYPKNVVLHDVAELPGTSMKELKKLLTI